MYGQAVREVLGNDAFLAMPPTRRCYRLSDVVVSSLLGLHVDRILAGVWVGAKK